VNSKQLAQLGEFAGGLPALSGDKAVELALLYTQLNQRQLAEQAGLQPARISEMRKELTLTRGQQNALVTALVRHWML